MLNDILVAYEKFDVGSTYPSAEYNFNPSICYPEYPWKKENISPEPNEVYELVRKSFYALGLDKENYGKSSWNPLGEIIKQNYSVLVKPNMVISQHEELECIVTHPSVIRVVLDYVYIALKGEGSVVIGDAPMQRCNFSDVVNGVKYDKLLEFYQLNGWHIKILDFRDTCLSKYSNINDDGNFILCDIGNKSFLCDKDKFYKRYRVTNYDYRKMKVYHNPSAHKYLIRKEVFYADVIIDVPKFKTHKKAGFTGALKNFVGTVVHKECLPHHIKGSAFSGGDEYLHDSICKKINTFAHEQLDLINIKQNSYLSKRFYEFILNLSEKMMYRFSQDDYVEGSWYGNDTIWRTFGDINRILMYADRNGHIQQTIQRNIFVVGDMIVAGEKEGPVHASAKNVGVILSGNNPLAVDCVAAKIMGFDYKKIPALKHLLSHQSYAFKNCKYENILLNSVSKKYKNVKLLALNDIIDGFIPSSGWKGHVELEVNVDGEEKNCCSCTAQL